MKDLSMTETMTREDVTAMILSAKKQAGLTWEGIADKIGMSPVWTHSAAMGMNAFPPEKAKLMVSAMGLPQEAERLLSESPTKIWEQAVPTDPCIYSGVAFEFLEEILPRRSRRQGHSRMTEPSGGCGLPRTLGTHPDAWRLPLLP